jgi:hypothetical protein
LRHHPRAPQAILTSVTELALETDRKLILDQDQVPLIPRYRDPVPEKNGAPDLEPSEPDET